MAHKDTSISERSDGVSSVLCGSEMVVYGGSNRSRVWCFNPEGMRWRTIECGGDVPEARKWHSAVEHRGEMYVFGGETSRGVDDGLYALATSGRDAFIWERVRTVGTPPAARSHHSAAVIDDYMYVLGGKQSSAPTQAAHRRLVREGFFDLYRIHLPSCEWEPVIAVSSTPARMPFPCLWGHTACMFRHFLLFFGGFRLEGPAVGEEAPFESPDERFYGIADQQPPTAELNDVVYIFNTQKREWTRNTPKTSVCPQPRALHNAIGYGSEMLIFGGLCLDTTNRTVPINDCWRWDIATGQWTYVAFCLKSWKSARLLNCVHQGTLYVIHDLASCYRLGLRAKGDWACLPCDMSGLSDVVVAADNSRRYSSIARRRKVVGVGGVGGGQDTEGVGSGSPGGHAKRHVVDAETKQRAALREEMRERLRQELEDETKAARSHEYAMLQKQIGTLKGQVEEMKGLQNAQRSPAAPLPNATDVYPAPLQTSYLPPTTEPPHPWDPALGSEVSKLIDAVDRLRALGGPVGFQEPGIMGPAAANGARTLASPMRPPSPVAGMGMGMVPPQDPATHWWKLGTPNGGGLPPPPHYSANAVPNTITRGGGPHTGESHTTHATHGTPVPGNPAGLPPGGVALPFATPSPYATTGGSDRTLSSAGQAGSAPRGYPYPQAPGGMPPGPPQTPMLSPNHHQQQQQQQMHPPHQRQPPYPHASRGDASSDPQWQWKILDFAGPSPAGSVLSDAGDVPPAPAPAAQPPLHIPRVSPPVHPTSAGGLPGPPIPGGPPPVPSLMQPLHDPQRFPSAQHAYANAMPPVPHPTPPPAGAEAGAGEGRLAGGDPWTLLHQQHHHHHHHQYQQQPTPAAPNPYAAPPAPLSMSSGVGAPPQSPVSAAGHGGDPAQASPTSFASPFASASAAPGIVNPPSAALPAAAVPVRNAPTPSAYAAPPTTPQHASPRNVSPLRTRFADAAAAAQGVGASPSFPDQTPAGISLGTDPRTVRFTVDARSTGTMDRTDVTPLSVADGMAARALIPRADAVSLAESTPPSVGLGGQRRFDHLQALQQQVHDIERAVRLAMGADQ